MKGEYKGNPYKRGETWTFFYYVKDALGNRKQVKKGGYKTKKEAADALAICKAEVIKGNLTAASDVTVGECLTLWLKDHKKDLQPSTVSGYNVNINNHIIPTLGDVKLKSLKTKQIDALYEELETEKGLSGKTIRYVHNTLNTALKWAVKKKLINFNVCEEAKPPKIKKYRHNLLSLEQMRTLTEYLKGNRYELEIMLAMHLGLRRGEVLGLKFSDVDFDRKELYIQRQVSTVKDTTEKKRSKKYYDIKCLKSDSSERVTGINDTLIRLIKERRGYIELQRRRLGELYDDLDLICCNDDGGILSPQTLYHAFKRIIKECGLPDVRLHDLRHSYATLCVDRGIPIKIISKSLGHSSIAITEQVYADSIEKNKIPDMIEAALNGDESAVL